MDYEDTRTAYEDALTAAFAAFRSHLSSSSKSEWRVVPPAANARPESTPTLNDAEVIQGIRLPGRVVVHRRPTKAGDVVRAVADFTVNDSVNLAAFAALLQIPEARKQWDPLVERAAILEQIDAQTQIVKTDFRLGWPINPRDAVTISRTLSDDTSVVHVATSLPKTAVEPIFLRSVPPYVRAQVALFAWRIHLKPHPAGAVSTDRILRVQLLWQWQLKGAAIANQYQHASTLVRSFVDQVRRQGVALPLLSGFGRECDIAAIACELDRQALAFDYTVLHDAGTSAIGRTVHEGAEELAAMKEARRLERSVEIYLPLAEGWDIALTARGQGQHVDASYRTTLERAAGPDSTYAVFRVLHAKVALDQLVKVRLVVTRLVGGKNVRVNGELTPVAAVEPRDPSSSYRRMLDDAATSINMSLESHDSDRADSVESAPRASPAEAVRAKATALLIRRCYNYFTSLLQEPEEKWRHLYEARGVGVGQLSSLDPTVAIYRAEKTIVGVNIWDVYSALLAPGIRTLWDPQNESVALLDDLGESTGLWHVATKAVWPAWARDAVLLQTSYKSANSIHVFAFSVNDGDLFPALPELRPSIIRTQVDVQGWSIEALSPTTTRIALIEQSDSKGWSTKSWTPQQMASMVAGLGEYAIRNGGPPMITRQLGAKLLVLRYEQEKGSLKAEYCVRRSGNRNGAVTPVVLTTEGEEGADFRAVVQESPPMLECEIRCNVDHWSACAELTIDPPPAKVSCLHRHRLSANGGGFWITIEHESALLADNERVTLLVRKGTTKDRTGVIVNGKRQKVEQERLADDDLKTLAAQKRTRALPVPLDRSSSVVPSGPASPTVANFKAASPPDAERAITAAGPAAEGFVKTAGGEAPTPSSTPPLSSALEALAALQTFHIEQSGASEDAVDSAWVAASHARTSKRLFEPLSSTHHVYRSERIIEKASAEQLVALISCSTSRPLWDDRIAKCADLEVFGNGMRTAVVTTRPAMLAFRPRTFFVATAAAFMQVPSPSAAASTANVYLVAMASFEPTVDFPAAALNPSAMPVGRIILDGWILESLDPYAGDDHPIPSTRCRYFTSVDYAGSMPTSVASMMHSDPSRIVDGLERFLRTRRLPRLVWPSPCVEAVGSLAAGTRIGGAPLEEGPRFVWQVRNGSSNVVHLLSDYNAATSTFSTTLAYVPQRKPPRPESHRSTTSVDPINGILHRPSVSELRKQASMSALRTMASRSKLKDGSLADQQVDGQGDLVVAECVLHTAAGASRYEVTAVANWSASTTTCFDAAAWLDRASLPWRVTISPVRADQLDPEAFSPARDAGTSSHVLRVVLPTSKLGQPVADPLRKADEAEETPAWYRRLQTDTLLVSLVISVSPTSSGSKQDGVHVVFDGQRLATGGERTGGDAQAIDEPSDVQHAQLSRVLAKRKPGTAELPDLPSTLVRPFAQSSLRLALPGKPDAADLRSPSATPSGLSTRAQTPDPSARPAVRAENGVSTSREGAATATVASKDGFTSTVFSQALDALDPSKLSVPPFLSQPRLSLGAVLVIALVAFLLGSLLRSLVGPTDFVLEAPTTDGVVDIRLLQALHPGRHWRPARRIVDFRLPRLFSKVEFMCAAVERGQV